MNATNVNTNGYDLYQITQDEWVLHVKGGSSYNGTFKKVVLLMVKNMGFKLSEVQYGAEAMIVKGHNAAHFGMYKGFIHTFNKEFGHGRKAS